MALQARGSGSCFSLRPVTVPAAAQTSESGLRLQPSGETSAGPSPSTGGCDWSRPTFPGLAPNTLPPPPGGGFGFPNPAAPPYSVNNEIPALDISADAPLAAAPCRRCAAAGLRSECAGHPRSAQRARWVRPSPTTSIMLIRPAKFAAHNQSLRRGHPSPPIRRGSRRSRLVRPTAVPLPAGNNSSLNQVYGTLYANGLATVVPDLLFVDFQSLITQSTTLPGFGFQICRPCPSNYRQAVHQ